MGEFGQLGGVALEQACGLRAVSDTCVWVVGLMAEPLGDGAAAQAESMKANEFLKQVHVGSSHEASVSARHRAASSVPSLCHLGDAGPFTSPCAPHVLRPRGPRLSGPDETGQKGTTKSKPFRGLTGQLRAVIGVSRKPPGGFDSRRLHDLSPRDHWGSLSVSTRLQNVSKTEALVDGSRRFMACRRWLFEHADRTLESRRRQVHVALRRRQVDMPGELLDRSGRHASHGQVRAKSVSQCMRSFVSQVGQTLGSQ